MKPPSWTGRPIDVCMITASSSTETRLIAKALNIISARLNIRCSPTGPLFTYRDYLRHLSRAKVGISLDQTDTLRFWETLGLGTLLLSRSIDFSTSVTNAPIPGVHYLSWEDPKRLVDQIRWALSNRQAAAEIATRGQTLVREYHSPKARARTILESVESALADQPLAEGMR